jgi:hypothetical protein
MVSGENDLSVGHESSDQEKEGHSTSADEAKLRSNAAILHQMLCDPVWADSSEEIIWRSGSRLSNLPRSWKNTDMAGRA